MIIVVAIVVFVVIVAIVVFVVIVAIVAMDRYPCALDGHMYMWDNLQMLLDQSNNMCRTWCTG